MRGRQLKYRYTFDIKAKLLTLCILAALFVGCANEPDSNIPEGDYINRTEEFDQLGGWKFRCKVYGEAQTVADNGGQVEFMKKVDQLLADASEYFQVSGINDEGGNQVHFYMTEFVEFEGSSREVMKLNESEVADTFDLRLVVNTHAATDDLAEGWLGEPYLAIGHTHQETWGTDAVAELVVNLARSRGVTPLNESKVAKENNEVIAMGFEADECVTNNPSNTRNWSDYAKSVINRAANKRVAKAAMAYMPSTNLKLRVLTAEGEIAKGSTMLLYPVYEGSGRVSAEAIYEGTMNSAGNMIFFKNPFTDEAPDDDERQIINYFVVINYEDVQGYGWMPLYEVLAAGAKGEKEYLKILQLTGNETYPPGQDYMLRKEEFEKLPGWKFRVKVFGEKQTVADYGGRIEFMKKVDKLMADASKGFQVEGLNDAGGNEVHFFMIGFEEFDGPSSRLMYRSDGADSKEFDCRVIINGHAQNGDVSGGWLGSPYLNLGHDFEGLWEGYALDALIHEFGHMRGVPDLYAAEVPVSGNPINGKAFEATKCIMNYPYGNKTWSEYAKLLINASADQRICVKHYNHFPKEGTQIKVVGRKDEPIVGAEIKCYPVAAYSEKVTPTARFVGTTDSEGTYKFPENPFVKEGSTNLDDNNTNNLIEITYNGKTIYRWLPMYEAETAGAKGETLFTKTIIFA
ncbi:MAG: hypothetical protein IJY45_03770 [Tidjanibacter sp.]|nr:hypothetical protein [Tidjanibacter sp.]